MRRRITLVEMPAPRGHNINYELQWIGNSLGLFGERDRDKSCFRIFITLVKEKPHSPISSDMIADQLGLSRGTVVHHINRLMSLGIVSHERSGYILRRDSLQQLIAELHRDVEQMFKNIEKVSKDIDAWLGL